MPNTKSAAKRMRQDQARRIRNRTNRTRMRSAIKKFHKLLSEQKVEDARDLLAEVYSVIDRSAQKGAIHSNTAARYKSRLTRHLNEASSAAKS